MAAETLAVQPIEGGSVTTGDVLSVICVAGRLGSVTAVSGASCCLV